MFPDKGEDDAVASLAEAIFSISRVDREDPISAWEDHQRTLTERQDWLNEQSFHSLHYKAPGTDFTLGLADGHEWKGGASTSLNGISCTPNIPTEEVFTTPHAERAEGTVRASKPLVHMGTLIDGIEVRFEGGRIVEARAERGGLPEAVGNWQGSEQAGEAPLSPIESDAILQPLRRERLLPHRIGPMLLQVLQGRYRE